MLSFPLVAWLCYHHFMLGIALAIVIDDPGPVLFTQKRMGQNKKVF